MKRILRLASLYYKATGEDQEPEEPKEEHEEQKRLNLMEDPQAVYDAIVAVSSAAASGVNPDVRYRIVENEVLKALEHLEEHYDPKGDMAIGSMHGAIGGLLRFYYKQNGEIGISAFHLRNSGVDRWKWDDVLQRAKDLGMYVHE